ncbi:stage V sporulation protein E [Acidimicrobiaceae bacterium]|nr:stage V sporulation protein E [Acidimicrobiaceae bacterium]
MSKFIPQIRASQWFKQSYDVVSVWKNIDLILLSAVTLQSIFGFFTVYSATRQRLLNQGFDQFYYVQRQVGFVLFAAALMLLVMGIGHDWIRERGVYWYAGSLFLLFLVLVIGAVSSGAKLSFDLGPISVQPAELMKVAVLILIAAYTSDSARDEINYRELVTAVLILSFPFVLILLQPDLGSATVLVAGVVGILLLSGAKRLWVIMFTLLTIVSAVVLAISGIIDNYQLRRFDAWLNQNSNEPALQKIVLQVRFAKRAVASGGFFGKGYLQGPLTNGAFIPVQFQDFPFSAIGEQFGMFGASIVLALFAVICWRLWVIAKASRNRFDQLLATGYFSMLLFQVFQNIGMTLGVTPVSGLPLPFISYGGSHLASSGLLMGLMQSIYMRRLR